MAIDDRESVQYIAWEWVQQSEWWAALMDNLVKAPYEEESYDSLTARIVEAIIEWLPMLRS